MIGRRRMRTICQRDTADRPMHDVMSAVHPDMGCRLIFHGALGV